MDEWLRSVGLGTWIAAFRDQKITLHQVADLSDDDLRELGLPIGDRKRFRGAVAALTQVERVPPIGRMASLAAETPIVDITRAERRPLTVMFVDVVNSSALGERLEAEDLLEVIRCYREFVGTAVNRFGGHIARFVGDGVLAYFCYPVATENDPERAVRAAVQIVRGIGGLETPARVPLNVRIGIATGRVIVSDLFAGGQPDMHSIIGSTPNLAARLQGFAPSGGIVIAEETYARVGRVFACEEMGKREIKGFAQPHNSWRVIAEASAFEHGRKVRQIRRLTPFYGRHAELGILIERWNRASVGEGGAVIVVGEPGVGKSRLVEHFLAINVDRHAKVLRFAGSALDEDSPLYPVICFLRHTARLDVGARGEDELVKLEAVLAGNAADRRSALPVIAELVGIACNDPATRALSPAQLRERILSVLVEQVLLLAHQQPLCLLVEDLHWLDPTSRELLERLLECIDGHAVMVLLTARVGFEGPWTARRRTSVLELRPLAPGDVANMVGSLFTNRAMPEDLSSLIVRRTDGIPLFVEEIARSLLAQQSLDGRDEAGLDLPDYTIPASLHESLMARLDKSGSAKAIAQIAAVIGRSARRDVLADAAGVPESELEQPLAALREAGVLLPTFSEGVETYTFSHALLRDAAYDSLLRGARRELHLRVAHTLEAHDPRAAARQPELLAMHLTEGNEAEAAAPYWLEAARNSLARGALTEATRLLRRGLNALAKLPDSGRTFSCRLELSALLGPALIALRGPASPEAQELYASAYALSEHVPDHPSQFPLYWGWWRVSREISIKKQRSSTLLARAVSRDDPELLLQAHHCNWATHFETGDFARCRAHIDLGLGIYRKGDYRHHARLYGNHDALVCGLGALAQVEWMLGRPLNGLAREHEAACWAKELNHVGTHVHSLDVRLLHRAHRRDHKEVFRLAGELISFTSEHGLADHCAKGQIFRGWSVAMCDDAQGGLRMLEEGLARQRQIGTLEDFPVYVCMHAEALARAGRPERAVEELQRERRHFKEIGLLFWMPEVLRVLAEVMLQADPASTQSCRALLREAADQAETQGVPMLGLRVALAAARLDKTEHTARHLHDILSKIEEDDGSLELAQARAAVTAWQSGKDALGSDSADR